MRRMEGCSDKVQDVIINTRMDKQRKLIAQQPVHNTVVKYIFQQQLSIQKRPLRDSSKRISAVGVGVAMS